MTNLSSTTTIRTRFAPSPTGYVHIGSLRTALFNFLFARHNQGQLILRVEDTDQTRLVEGAVENLLKVMKELGIEFDEGPYLNSEGRVQERGEYGPYEQSKRLDLYKQYAEQLVAQGSAYYCFCNQQRLEDLRKEQTALKKPPMYDRHCRNLSKEQMEAEMEQCKAEGRTPVVRQAIPLEGQTVIRDLIYGDISYEHRVLDDQVLLKSDGFPTYHLAVVVDDHLMDISHVIRGDEWIPSTPKHILLFKALGWDTPQYAHMPLILNPDKSKLSKRQGDVAVEDFLAKGYLKEALINFVAFLGWNPKTEQEIFSLNDLTAQFDLAKVNKSGAIFDINKLDWINGLYIRAKSESELADLLIPYWIKDGMIVQKEGEYVGPAIGPFDDTQGRPELNRGGGRPLQRTYLESIASLEKDRLKKLSEIGERTRYFFTDPDYEPQLLVWKKSTPEDAKQKLSELHELLAGLDDGKFNKTDLESAIKEFITQHGYDNGSVLWPLRTALTGQQASPGPFEVTATLHLGLGKETILRRIQNGVNKLGR